MDKAYFVNEFGNANVLMTTPISVSTIKSDEILIKQTAFGVNFLDIYQRNGQHGTQLPFIPGVEAIGFVEDVGRDVKHIQIGDRVAYTGCLGGYTKKRVLAAWRAIKIPSNLPDELVAANLLRLYTAHMLLSEIYPIKPNDIILIHAASGGLATILVPYAKQLGAKIIGIVGSNEKANIARLNGVDIVLVGRNKDFTTQVMQATNNKGVDFIIDGIAGAGFYHNFAYLRRFGLVANIGWVEKPMNELNILKMQQGMFIRPSVLNYCSNHDLYQKSAPIILDMLAKFKDNMKTNIFKFDELTNAHKALESGLTSGGICVLT